MKSKNLTNRKTSMKFALACSAIGWMYWSAANVCNAQTPPADLSPALQHVLTLSKGGMSDDVIITYISTSTNSSATYTLSDHNMIYLHKQGVSDAVIKALLQTASSANSNPTLGASASSPVPPPLDANPSPSIVSSTPNTPPAPAPMTATLNKGLMAYYPFNGNANDQSGNGNNGTVCGAVYETYGAGQTALRFNGTAATYVVVPRSASLEPQDAFTVSLWCQGVPGTGQQYGTIIRKADNCGAGYYIRTADSSSSGIPETFRLDPSNPCAGGNASVAAFTTSTGASWQHLVATYSSNDGLRTYVNGVLVSQTPPVGQLQHSGDLFIGGATVHDQDGGFNGLINDVRIYNRALSANEIQALYNK